MFIFGFVSIFKIKTIHWWEIYDAKFKIFKNNSLAVMILDCLWKTVSGHGS